MVTIKDYFILFKFATRSRPEKFFKGLDNIINNLHDKKNFAILVTADIDDAHMYNKDVLERLIPYVDNHNVIPIFGYSKNKIDAINRDMDKAPDNWEILVNFSDDMQFNKYGFDKTIREKFALHFPSTDGNIYFNDGYAKDSVSTMSIIGRVYYNRFSYIYHPSYVSLWCDNEYTDIAKRLNKIQYFPEQLYTHFHAINTGAVADEQLIRTESYSHQDNKNYELRKAKNFYAW